MTFAPDLIDTAVRLLAACRARGLTIATAESCTGGLIAALLTEIPGSSDVVDRGFVTYSNGAKVEMLGVPQTTLSEHGAVSEETARAMVAGALARSGAGLAVAVTGIAGPGGGSAAKPVGRVHVAVQKAGATTRHLQLDLSEIGRAAVREETVRRALTLLEAALDDQPAP